MEQIEYEYEVISDSDLSQFNKELREYVREGWAPSDQLVVNMTHRENTYSSTKLYSLLLKKIKTP